MNVRFANSRTLSVVLNALLVVAAGTLIVRLFVTPYMSATTTPGRMLRPGATLHLAGVAWTTARRHVVLVLNSTCPSCINSADFYKELTTRVATTHDTRLLIITPEPLDTINAWLVSRDIGSTYTRQITNLLELGFSEVPTLLIIDSSGTITDMLTRKLSATEEHQVFRRLAGDLLGPLFNRTYANELTVADFDRIRDSLRPVVVDIRERQDYRANSRRPSLNIPLQELPVRGPAELSPSVPILLDCSVNMPINRCRRAGELLLTEGYSSVSILLP